MRLLCRALPTIGHSTSIGLQEVSMVLNLKYLSKTKTGAISFDLVSRFLFMLTVVIIKRQAFVT